MRRGGRLGARQREGVPKHSAQKGLKPGGQRSVQPRAQAPQGSPQHAAGHHMAPAGGEGLIAPRPLCATLGRHKWMDLRSSTLLSCSINVAEMDSVRPFA